MLEHGIVPHIYAMAHLCFYMISIDTGYTDNNVITTCRTNRITKQIFVNNCYLAMSNFEKSIIW